MLVTILYAILSILSAILAGGYFIQGRTPFGITYCIITVMWVLIAIANYLQNRKK